jgi:purine nucleosidase
MKPEIVEKVAHKYVQIERSGDLTRGMTVVDWWETSQKPPNVHIVMEVNLDRFYKLLSMIAE